MLGGGWHVCRRFGISGVIALALAAAPGRSEPAHYIVAEVDDSGALVPVFARRVELPASPRSLTIDEMQFRTETAQLALRPLELIDSRGTVQHRGLIEIPEWIRGEFHGESAPGGGWSIDAHAFRAERPSVVLRVPAIPGSLLHVGGSAPAIWDLDELQSRAASLRLGAMEVPSGQALAGSVPDNRADLLIVGDGYTAAQSAQFQAAAANMENSFFSITPYAQYANFVRVTRLFVASNQSGADHPPYSASCAGDNPACCADTLMLSDPLRGQYRDTAFGARYCAYNIHRLLVVNSSAVYAAAAAVPTWDRILVLVNDGTYGGSGGFLSVSSVHPSAVDVARHEFGHSFTRLADEYESAYPGYPACSDVTGPACEANVTDQTSPALIKWEPWIAGSTPVPTPETPTYAGAVGLFEGARYQTAGVYRPRNTTCLMRSLGQPFCQVCSQEYVRLLYAGGWGTPANGIDPIEPGSESPAPGPVESSGSVSFSVDLLQPAGGPALTVRWYVDGVQQPSGSGSPSFEFIPAGTGTFLVELRVIDPTGLVHPELDGGLLESARTWTVHVAGLAGRVDSTLRIDKSITPGKIVLTWERGCSPDADDYAILEGTIGDYYSHAAKDCHDDGAALTEEITPAVTGSYYLVVPLSDTREGSYGTDSSGVERPIVGPTCQPQQIVACPE